MPRRWSSSIVLSVIFLVQSRRLRRADADAVIAISTSRDHFCRLLSIVAQACATAALAESPPGIVAQPPFSIKEPCCQELTLLSSARFAVASALRWNLSTQTGESADTRAVLTLFCTCSLAVPPVTQPPHEKPTIMVATAPAAAPCRRRVSESPWRIDGSCI